MLDGSLVSTAWHALCCRWHNGLQICTVPMDLLKKPLTLKKHQVMKCYIWLKQGIIKV